MSSMCIIIKRRTNVFKLCQSQKNGVCDESTPKKTVAVFRTIFSLKIVRKTATVLFLFEVNVTIRVQILRKLWSIGTLYMTQM